MSPNGKYFDRAGKGNSKYNMGWDEEDLSMTVKPGGESDKTMAMPSEKTQDKPRDQDGNAGKPWAKTLASRRGSKDHAVMDSPGKYGGPNAG